MLLEIPAMPMPAAMLAKTIPRDVNNPTKAGPMIDCNGSCYMS